VSEGLRSIRPLGPESLRSVTPAVVGKRLPKFELVDPRTLFVEEEYQRAILENGVALIRKIYSAFDWSRFKPPVCVRLEESGNVLVCIDGQHTATACATHPDIPQIPVMVVSAADVAARAAAFVGHNKDRLALTTVMIYAAELAAGDPLAVTVDRACKAAGASIPRKAIWTSAGNKTSVGVTMSIGTIKAIAKRQGEEALVRVLKLLVAAGRGPIKSVEIAAAALICSLHPAKIDARLARIVAGETAEEWTARGMIEAAATGNALAVAVAALWCGKLDVEAPESALKGNATDHARIIGKEKKPAQAEQPTPQPAKELPAGDHLVRRNGVTFDLQTYELTHRGHTVRVRHDDGTPLVAALARVMPAMLGFDRLAKVIGVKGMDAPAQVRNIVEDINPVLRRARLEIKTIPKMGHTLYDLGPE
jgi:hypothetical protein